MEVEMEVKVNVEELSYRLEIDMSVLFWLLEIEKDFALQAKALLKLHRLQEADDLLTNGPNFDMDDCTQLFGPIDHAILFDDAVVAAQRAARPDSSSKEVNMVVRRTRAVAMARSNGNDLFGDKDTRRLVLHMERDSTMTPTTRCCCATEPLAGPNSVNLRKQSRTALLSLMCTYLIGKPD
ncbi:hypothetical protein LOK49_LG03G00807 [Camellia lanceoleosa]|uniref:Uncharacterized protein n=1 Tax=Camellia lanceoleosa TaxID=1840588 RepID=A0ACC0IE11_9ERIC|nr:hypothetical protein LOK49_LG03G00807 [Camellia lanceoleosa]